MVAYMVQPVPYVVITVLSVRLMMDEGTIRNMYSCLQKYNKTVYIVTPCWTIIDINAYMCVTPLDA